MWGRVDLCPDWGVVAGVWANTEAEWNCFPPALPVLSVLYCITVMPVVHPRLAAPPPPPPCWDARLVRSAPPLSYVSAMVVSIGRRSNDSACLPLCTFPRWCTPDEDTLPALNRLSECFRERPERLRAWCPSESKCVFGVSETIHLSYMLICPD